MNTNTRNYLIDLIEKQVQYYSDKHLASPTPAIEKHLVEARKVLDELNNPPQWINLTIDDMVGIWTAISSNLTGADFITHAEAINAKIREKNTIHC